MYTLAQSKRVRGSNGEPLPTVFRALEAKGIVFRRGQLVLVCAGPGTGKSAFILSYILKAAIPAMYFSADSDAFTQLVRSISILKGWDLARSAEMVLNEDLDSVEYDLADVPVRMNYDASPSLDRIEQSLQSYFEVYEEFPSAIVVDNVTNVRAGGDNDEDPFSGLESLMDYLHQMARETNAAVFGLHHVTGAYNDAAKPIPLSGVKGQITRVPEMVLTMFRPDNLCVSGVKNRGGKADPSGEDFAELSFEGESMRIEDLPVLPGFDMQPDRRRDEEGMLG